METEELPSLPATETTSAINTTYITTRVEGGSTVADGKGEGTVMEQMNSKTNWSSQEYDTPTTGYATIDEQGHNSSEGKEPTAAEAPNPEYTVVNHPKTWSTEFTPTEPLVTNGAVSDVTGPASAHAGKNNPTTELSKTKDVNSDVNSGVTSPTSAQAGKSNLTTKHATAEAPNNGWTDAGGLATHISQYTSRSTTRTNNDGNAQNTEQPEDPFDERKLYFIMSLLQSNTNILYQL